MYRMQSGGWPYSEDDRDSSKAPSLRVAFLRTAVFRSLRVHAQVGSWLVQYLPSTLKNCLDHYYRMMGRREGGRREGGG